MLVKTEGVPAEKGERHLPYTSHILYYVLAPTYPVLSSITEQQVPKYKVRISHNVWQEYNNGVAEYVQIY
jgi:hypothetical protein